MTELSQPHHHHLPKIRYEGPKPFVTLRSYTHRGRQILWRSRQNRKGLLPAERGQDTTYTPVWLRRRYNWMTGLIFALGSFLFMLGATLSLLPSHWAITPSALVANIVFFLGSIPFTTAGYMQLFQAANAPAFQVDPNTAGRPERIHLIGWHPKDAGWLSSFTQFIGTVAFNFNTFDAIRPVSEWYLQDVTIWMPGFIGSILFLVSGYLAFIETCHGYWAWKPRDLDWMIVAINLLGCIFFMTAGIVSFIPKGTDPTWALNLANIHLWLGGFCFLLGAALLMRESRQAPKTAEPTAASPAAG